MSEQSNSSKGPIVKLIALICAIFFGILAVTALLAALLEERFGSFLKNLPYISSLITWDNFGSGYASFIFYLILTLLAAFWYTRCCKSQ